jgi:Domain of unknown function (DUF4166)
MTLLPFQRDLEEDIQSAPPLVRKHFLQPDGTRRYSGVMTRVWRCTGWKGMAARPILWLASLSNMLFAETGEDVPFELENTVTPRADGLATMSWMRTFLFPRRTRRFSATMCYHPDRRVILDWLSKGSRLEVELRASIEDGAVVVKSGRQWVHIGGGRIAIPPFLRGNAHAREWQVSTDTLGVRVTISNPILGLFFGYEGTFSEVPTNRSGRDTQ